jgi:dTDP-4-amino-4,6-dideoxygalactose transaminase
MDPIMDLAEQQNLKVIEDCAQAHGARYKGRSVGCIGHVGAWSFCQDKIMTTGGEGGMVSTNDEALWSAMWSYKDHGKSYDTVYSKEHPPGFRWLHESFGTNWRMTEMQAAIGRIQLRRLPNWIAQRQANAEKLTLALQPFAGKTGPIRMPAFGYFSECGAVGSQQPDTSDCEHAQYKFYAYVRPENLGPGWSRDRIVDAINAEGVPCYQGTCSEVYLEKAFDNTGWRPAERLSVARELGATSLMFLVHPTLTENEIEKTAQAIQSVFMRVTQG